MSAMRNTRTKWFLGLAVSCLALALAVTHAPAVAGTSVAADGQAPLSVFANIPLNGMQHGQFCQAYANVYGGSGTYTEFEWTGQFEGSGQSGPQGPGQIINGYIDSTRDHWLRVWVKDSNGDTFSHTANLQITGEFNEDCEA